MNAIGKIERLSRERLYSEDLGIDLRTASGRFKWFLAALLFGARISEAIAMRTYRQFEAAGIDSPDRVLAAGWDKLVTLLDAGGYTRYDYSTATRLLNIMQTLKDRYGDLDTMRRQSRDAGDLKGRLQQFRGIGPTTAEIFLREMRGPWKISPDISATAQPCARGLGLDLSKFQGKRSSRIETGLVKLYLRHCKGRKCPDCDFTDCCQQALEEHASTR